MKRRSYTAPLAGVALVTAIGFAPAPVVAQSAQSEAQFYRGKTISVYIGFAPGGSYDFFGRLVARHIGAHIPGNPNAIAQTMTGAGSFKLANYLYAAAPKDGTAIGIITQTVALEEALGTPGVMYKSANFNWIGRATAILEVTLTWHTSRAKTIEDAKKYVTPVASTGSGSPSEGYPKLLNALIGTKFKIITGYTGSTAGMLAMEKGEVDGALTSWNTLRISKQDWIRDKKINLLVQYANQRDPDLPNVPAVVELGKTPQDKAVLAFYASGAAVGRSFVAPPGLSPARVKTLRTAFSAMITDPAFLAEIHKAKAEFSPASGEEVQKLIEGAANAPKEVQERTKALIQGRGK